MRGFGRWFAERGDLIKAGLVRDGVPFSGERDTSLEPGH
jgi:hypothetical protein